MSGLAGCQVREILVDRTGDNRFWCRAIRGPRSAPIDLGPLLLGFDGQLTDQWSGEKHLLGGHTDSFLTALRTFLDQRGIIAEVRR